MTLPRKKVMLKKKPLSKAKVAAPAPPDISTRIIPVADTEDALSVCLYGRSGTGKTTLAATFPKPCLFLDIKERGTRSVKKVKEVFSVQCDTWDDIENIYWFLKEGTHEYKTVVLDAAHSMQDVCMEHVLKQDGKTVNDQITKRDWGAMSSLMKSMVIQFRDLGDVGINVIFLCHDRTTESDEDSSEQIDPSVGPRLSPSVASTMIGSVQLVCNTFIREKVTKAKQLGQKSISEMQYCLRIGPHAFYQTKVRSPKGFKVPDVMVDPTFDKLVKVVEGELGTGSFKTVVLKRK